MAGFLSKLLTFGEGKQLKNYQALADKIGGLEPEMQAKSDEQLRAFTDELRGRVQAGASTADVLPEAFAAVREASVRTLGMRHFDVQLIGGMALNDGQIAEMRTGEGKTLVSTLAGYLNALGGQNVHIVTVNDYLARRDSQWMGQVYEFLGMSVGLIQNGMHPEAKKLAYQADVTYGTNSEFGFDYLRDNMVTRADARVQRGHHFAIVDEVDSILIDEARTPLIISGAGTRAADTYNKFARVMPALKLDEDFEMDEAKKTINATESGLTKIETMLGIDDIYADPSGQLPNHLQQALKAQFLFHRDVDYVVVNGEVKIVDEFTGRIMEGRRYSEGLHQALEAKEHVQVREENQTLATITLQNYFRLYDKLSGMTGTAMTEDAEFRQIYKLPVVAIPPNKQVKRIDEDDLIYRTVDAKFHAVADDVAVRHQAGQPCLIGTVSIESSEKSRACSTSAASSMRRSTRKTTSARPISSPRPAVSAPSPSPRTWRVAVPTSCSAATPTCSPTTCCSSAASIPISSQACSPPTKAACRRPRRSAQGGARHRARNVQSRAEARLGCWRLVRHRHRTPRKPTHRQPAARPCRPSGETRAPRSSTCRSKMTLCVCSAVRAWIRSAP